MSNAADLLALARTVALEAGALIKERRLGTVEVAATKSSPTDVVTAADLAAEQVIRERILSSRPSDGFVGEEGDEVCGTSGVTWVVDPIDGTVNYLYGIPRFAVSIAAEVNGHVVAGVVHDPMTNDTYTAISGQGAERNGQPIWASACRSPASALVGVGYGYRADVRTHQAAEIAQLVPRVRDIRRHGSAALDLCSVACGQLDAYAERGLKPWDLAAGRLIATEAGARIEGINGAEPDELLVIAAPTGLFDSLHAIMLECGYGDWPLNNWP